MGLIRVTEGKYDYEVELDGAGAVLGIWRLETRIFKQCAPRGVRSEITRSWAAPEVRARALMRPLVQRLLKLAQAKHAA